MKNELRSAAQRMLARGHELGFVTKNGTALVVDQMEELLAAKEGYRNAHAYRAALATREAPALVQEHPDEAGNDFKLVEGRGCWISMGAFAVHPYLTDEGVVVDVFANGAETESIASTYAFTADAEAEHCEFLETEIDVVAAWAASAHKVDLDTQTPEQRVQWIRRYGAEFPVRGAEALDTPSTETSDVSDALPAMDSVMRANGLGLGLSNDEANAGTWEWYGRETKEFRSGFATKAEAYRSAADYLNEVDGVELPTLNEDDELVFAGNAINADGTETGRFSGTVQHKSNVPKR